MRHIIQSASLLVCLLLGSTASYAAKAVFLAADAKNTNVIIEVSAEKMRVGTDPDKGGYLIARDQRLYVVSTLAGRQMVMDAVQMLQLAKHTSGAMGSNLLNLDKYTRDISGFVRLTDTQRKETVGGITGSVHQLVYTDGNGNERMVETVMTHNPTMAAMTEQLLALAQTIHANASSTGQDGVHLLTKEIRQRKLGLLRFGNELSLQRLDDKAVSANRFALPQGSANLQGLFK